MRVSLADLECSENDRQEKPGHAPGRAARRVDFNANNLECLHPAISMHLDQSRLELRKRLYQIDIFPNNMVDYDSIQ